MHMMLCRGGAITGVTAVGANKRQQHRARLPGKYEQKAGKQKKKEKKQQPTNERATRKYQPCHR